MQDRTPPIHCSTALRPCCATAPLMIGARGHDDERFDYDDEPFDYDDLINLVTTWFRDVLYRRCRSLG